LYVVPLNAHSVRLLAELSQRHVLANLDTDCGVQQAIAVE
jgi:hypothetical protein